MRLMKCGASNDKQDQIMHVCLLKFSIRCVFYTVCDQVCDADSFHTFAFGNKTGQFLLHNSHSMIDRVSCCLSCFWYDFMCVSVRERSLCFNFCILFCPLILWGSFIFVSILCSLSFSLSVSFCTLAVYILFIRFPLLLSTCLCRPVCQKWKTVSLEQYQSNQNNTKKDAIHDCFGPHRDWISFKFIPYYIFGYFLTWYSSSVFFPHT